MGSRIGFAIEIEPAPGMKKIADSILGALPGAELNWELPNVSGGNTFLDVSYKRANGVIEGRNGDWFGVSILRTNGEPLEMLDPSPDEIKRQPREAAERMIELLRQAGIGD